MVEYNDHRSGSINKVERIGNTVRRPMHRWTPAVHGLFRHLEDIDFKGVPRLLGVDGEHEVLTFIEGEAGFRPWMEILKTDQAIEQIAGFLRSYHLGVKEYIPPMDAEWYVPGLKWRPGLIIRHGDLGPWNTVWHDGDLTGVIDWDFAEPGEPIQDLAQVAWYLVPLRGWDYWKKVGSDHPLDLRKRLKVLCDSYGSVDPVSVIDALIELQEMETDRISALGASGIDPWKLYRKRGDSEEIEREKAWLQAEYRNLV